jgi:hypothetical protein
MNEAPTSAGLADLPPTIGSRRDFIAALQGSVRSAVAKGARRMLWADRDLAEWPLDDPALLEAMTQWLRMPRRHLVLVAHDFDGVSRRCPRFVAWYRMWSHGVSAFSPAPSDAGDLPCLLLVEGMGAVLLVDKEHWRGRISLDSREVNQFRDSIDALLQRSDPAFPATTLGL